MHKAGPIGGGSARPGRRGGVSGQQGCRLAGMGGSTRVGAGPDATVRLIPSAVRVGGQ
jgi:hypothetical protein